jgi:hypothetical protein
MVYRVLFGITTVVVVCVSFAFRESNPSFRSLGIGEENHRGAGWSIWVAGTDCALSPGPACETGISVSPIPVAPPAGGLCSRPVVCDDPTGKLKKYTCVVSSRLFFNTPCTIGVGAAKCVGFANTASAPRGVRQCQYVPSPLVACGVDEKCSG